MAANWTHDWTEEDFEFIRENIGEMTWKEFAPVFNEWAGTSLSPQSIHVAAWKRGISNGRVGTTGLRGDRNSRSLPVGSEVVRDGGYVFVKQMDGTWRQRAQLAWEEANGPIPEGFTVVHADGDPANDDPANLLLLDDSAKPYVSLIKQKGGEAVTNLTAVAYATLRRRTADLERGMA